MALEAIRYRRGRLHILDQLLLPHTTRYQEIRGVQEGWEAIRDMKVRGAPAIAVVGCLSLAVELEREPERGASRGKQEMVTFVLDALSFLVTARPTAVNLARAAGELNSFLSLEAARPETSAESLRESLLCRIEAMLEKDVQDNLKIGKHGADHILAGAKGGKVRILTHCNTGSLATAGHGTALGVIRSLHAAGGLEHVYCTETRPYNQGARLTAYELVYENIPGTLIADSMAAIAMKDKGISAVVVGADRVVANGDTANKVGTFLLAIAAQYHAIPFYVAAASSTWDPALPRGDAIVIEERPPAELTSINGIPIAAHGINVWNPAFDVTPHELITGGIITEFGVHRPAELGDALSRALKTS